MRPVLFIVGGQPLYSYWFFFGLGMLGAVLLALVLSKYRKLPFYKMWLLCFSAVFVAFIIARLSSVGFGMDIADTFDFSKGGEVSFGGLWSAFVVLAVGAKLFRLKTTDVLDVATPSVFLAQGIQRIGCFLNGCCHGPVSDSWLAYRCAKSISPAGDIVGTPCFMYHLELGFVSRGDASSLPVFPIQLLSSAICILMAGALAVLVVRSHLEGKLLWLSLLIYGLLRFVIQWYRPNYGGGPLVGWNDGHTLSLITGVMGLLGLVMSGYVKGLGERGRLPRRTR